MQSIIASVLPSSIAMNSTASGPPAPPSAFAACPTAASEKSITKARYRRNLLIPITIFKVICPSALIFEF